jgi:hypothetical protein
MRFLRRDRLNVSRVDSLTRSALGREVLADFGRISYSDPNSFPIPLIMKQAPTDTGGEVQMILPC